MIAASRTEALSSGARFYRGRQCACGHFTRYAKDQHCVACRLERAASPEARATGIVRSRDYRERGRKAIAILAELGVEI